MTSATILGVSTACESLCLRNSARKGPQVRVTAKRAGRISRLFKLPKYEIQSVCLYWLQFYFLCKLKNGVKTHWHVCKCLVWKGPVYKESIARDGHCESGLSFLAFISGCLVPARGLNIKYLKSQFEDSTFHLFMLECWIIALERGCWFHAPHQLSPCLHLLLCSEFQITYFSYKNARSWKWLLDLFSQCESHVGRCMITFNRKNGISLNSKIQ